MSTYEYKLYSFGPISDYEVRGVRHRSNRGMVLGLTRFQMLTTKSRYRRLRELGLSSWEARGIIFDLLFAASTGEPSFYSLDTRTGEYVVID